MSKMKRTMCDGCNDPSCPTHGIGKNKDLTDVVQELMTTFGVYMDNNNKVVSDLTECVKLLKARVEALEDTLK